MSSIHQAARLQSTGTDLLGDWQPLVFGLVALHLGAVLVWVLLWVLQALRGGEGEAARKLSDEKQD